MSLSLITGKVGSGKSYLGNELGVMAGRQNAVVHSNLDFYPDRWTEKEIPGKLVLFDVSKPFAEWKTQLIGGEEGRENLLIIDESMLHFHIHDQQKHREQNRELMELLTWSRKMGLECYFIAINAKNIDVGLRRMAEYEIKCKAVKNFPLIGWLWVFLWGDFRRETWPGGESSGKMLTATYHRFDPSIAYHYNTHATTGRDVGIAKNATRTGKKDSSQGRGKRGCSLLLALVVATVGWFAYVTYKQFHPDKDGGGVAAGIHQTGTQSAAKHIDGSRVGTVYIQGSVAYVFMQDGQQLRIGSYIDGEEIKSLTMDGGAVIVGTTKHQFTVELQNNHQSNNLWKKSLR